MPSTKNHTGNGLFTKPTKSKTHITKVSKATKPQLPITKASKTSSSTRIKELEADIKNLQTRLNQEKEDHLETHAQVTALESENAQRGGLKMKRLREEVEDLTQRTQAQELQIGTLRLQLRDERQKREQRDGTTGFLRFSKNDPDLWMSGAATLSGGGGGGEGEGGEGRGSAGSKRKRAGDSEGAKPKEAEEDLLARKKRENEEWIARRKGQVDEDDEEEEPSEKKKLKLEIRLRAEADKDDEEEVPQHIKIKFENKRASEELKKRKAETAAQSVSGQGEEADSVGGWASRFAGWISTKPIKTEPESPSKNVMDIDDYLV